MSTHLSKPIQDAYNEYISDGSESNLNELIQVSRIIPEMVAKQWSGADYAVLEAKLLELLLKLEQYDPTKGLLFSWLYRSIERKVKEEYRKNKRFVELPETVSNAARPCKHLSLDERIAIDQFLSRLDPEERQVMELFLDHQTDAEISEQTGLHPQKVWRIRTRLLKQN